MKCTSKIRIKQFRIKELSQAAVRALEQTTEELHTEVVQAQVVPRDTGRLQGESFHADYTKASSGRTSLVHSTPYARRLYFHPEYNFKKTENPNARGKWFEDWEPRGKKQDFAPRAFKELYRRNAGL